MRRLGIIAALLLLTFLMVSAREGAFTPAPVLVAPVAPVQVAQTAPGRGDHHEVRAARAIAPEQRRADAMAGR
ncbi:MAG: hypothetical protein QM723_31615 [Myxococcaceae bacterium]